MDGLMTLDDGLISAVMTHLSLPHAEPDEDFLHQIMWAYVTHVPWESASRLARKRVGISAEMAQTPAQFWHNHLRHGTGGTCFESNLAFLALLQALGFEGYLTINNMGATQACHTATVLVIDGQQWLADAGLPTFAALRLDASAETVITTPILTYTVRPDGPFTFQIERAPHPSPNAFTLLNLPIALDAYWQATRNDYGPHGFFLDKLVINKVIDGQLWRYSSADAPPRMEQFVDRKRVDWTLDGDWVSAVGERFGIDVAILAEAMQAL